MAGVRFGIKLSAPNLTLLSAKSNISEIKISAMAEPLIICSILRMVMLENMMSVLVPLACMTGGAWSLSHCSARWLKSITCEVDKLFSVTAILVADLSTLI